METLFRTSRPEVFCKIVALKKFAKFTGKQLCGRLFFNKNAMLATLSRKRLSHRCFPVRFAKIFNNSFPYRLSPVAASDFNFIPTYCTHSNCHINPNVFMHFKYLLALGTGPLSQILLFCP